MCFFNIWCFKFRGRKKFGKIIWKDERCKCYYEFFFSGK